MSRKPKKTPQADEVILLPAPPYLDPDGTPTRNGLLMAEQVATELGGAGDLKIMSLFDLEPREYKKLCEAHRPLRMALLRGEGENKAAVVRGLNEQAEAGGVSAATLLAAGVHDINKTGGSGAHDATPLDPNAPRFAHILSWMLPDTVALVTRDAVAIGLHPWPSPGPIIEAWRVNNGLEKFSLDELKPLYDGWVNALMAVTAFKHSANAQPEKLFERPLFPPRVDDEGRELPIIEPKGTLDLS